MKTKFLLTMGIFLILTLSFVGVALSKAIPQKGPDPGPFSNLTLEIGSTKQEFMPLEPIPLILTLNNETKKPVIGHTALALAENYVELFLIGADWSVRKFEIAKPVTKLAEAGQKIFQPGETYQSKELITVATKDVIVQPGEYRIQAVLHGANWHDEIKSNFLVIRVGTPTGRDKDALDSIKRESSLSQLFADYDLSDKQAALDTLKRLSTDFSGTAYSDYATFRVGEFYFHKGDYQKAKTYFDRLAEKKDFIFANKVSKYRETLTEEP